MQETFYGEYANKDPFNLLGKRNLQNADKSQYNCGGFALGTFSWYVPFGVHESCPVIQRTNLCVESMLEDFPWLRCIYSLAEVGIDEYAIAFRLETMGHDFHFIRRNDDGIWLHKRGSYQVIETMEEEDVFSECWLTPFIRYDGPLILFAMKNS